MTARVSIASAALLALWSAASWAANASLTWRTTPSTITSGTFNGSGDREHIAWQDELELQEAGCVRIYFTDVNLGRDSYILLHAANGDLRLDAVSMKEYFYGSAILAGGRIGIELHVAPNDHDVSIRIDRIMTATPGPVIETLCGGDDRVHSTDNRVCRLTRTVGASSTPYCTAWRIGNGAFLTAGHCADLDPDGSGPMLPDGTLDMAGFVEFNVPNSTAAGGLVLASTNDQYPVDVTNVRWRFDGENQGLGKDWAVFPVNKNANTRLYPHEVYGVPFRITRELPTTIELLRVTGFGTDSGVDNQTNQTSTGAFVAEASSGANIWLEHRVDTMPANSGSPIIWDDMNLAIGIHTNGGCDNTAESWNAGTSFEVDALENAINDFPGNDTTYLDMTHPMRVAEEGTLFRPYQIMANALAATPNGGILSMYQGIYALPYLDRPVTLQGPVGGVYLVNPAAPPVAATGN